MGIFGLGVFTLVDLPDSLSEVGWGRGGGCGSRYYYEGEQTGVWGGHCWEYEEREEFYCPYHEEEFSEEEWKEHFDDCPMYE